MSHKVHSQNHILLYLVLFFFPLLPILFHTTRSRYTDISGAQDDDCHSENNPDSKSPFYFLDAVWQRCEFIIQNKLQSSSGGYHSIRNTELLSLQCPFRRNPVDAGNPVDAPCINRETPRTQRAAQDQDSKVWACRVRQCDKQQLNPIYYLLI